MTDYTEDDTIDHERMMQWTIASKLPYTLTKGVTATWDGLVFNSILQVSAEYFDYRGNPTLDGPIVIKWPDVAERLRYREGEPWATVSDRDDDMPVACGYGDPKEWGGTDAAYTLHRITAILCDDAEAFRVLHWCIYNITRQQALEELVRESQQRGDYD